MANPQFPSTLANIQDSKYYTVEQEDPSLKTEMEGGYVISRPRHTRYPRRTFTSGLTNIGDTERTALMSFWDQMRGPSNLFDWINPPDGGVWTVRFVGKLNWKYVGMGGNDRWDVQFTLEQA